MLSENKCERIAIGLSRSGKSQAMHFTINCRTTKTELLCGFRRRGAVEDTLPPPRFNESQSRIDPRHIVRLSTWFSAFGTRGGYTVLDAFGYQPPFKMGNGPKNVEYQFTGCGRGVDFFF